jgi:hypothetical protein
MDRGSSCWADGVTREEWPDGSKVAVIRIPDTLPAGDWVHYRWDQVVGILHLWISETGDYDDRKAWHHQNVWINSWKKRQFREFAKEAEQVAIVGPEGSPVFYIGCPSEAWFEIDEEEASEDEG